MVQDSDLGDLAYRASFRARNLIEKAHSIQVEIGNDLVANDLVALDSSAATGIQVETGSPFESEVVIDS